MNSNISTYSHIISKSSYLFSRYGYKAVTLDDISTHCGISKKTLYLFFENKIDLVKKVVGFELTQFGKQLEEIRIAAKDAVDEQLRLIEVIDKLSARLSPSASRDLSKFYQEASQLLEDFRRECLLPFLESNLDKGVSAGLYLEGYHHKAIAYIRMMQLEAIVYKRLSTPAGITNEECVKQLNCHFVSGITTQKGFRIFNKYIQSKTK